MILKFNGVDIFASDDIGVMLSICLRILRRISCRRQSSPFAIAAMGASGDLRLGTSVNAFTTY